MDQKEKIELLISSIKKTTNYLKCGDCGILFCNNHFLSKIHKIGLKMGVLILFNKI